ncbi:hypothetical protein [Streptomyces sp. CC224B]|uniref:hypothetical protein n=1 Tax=Streptomyces sp. CC224B TaxID=3044571 RepID=UPI0024A8F16B|nr:hypothetical protein [Streptomyces sp. CC224B]
MRTSVPLALTFTLYSALALAPPAHAEGGGATAQVTPASVAPGGQVTVTVTCPSTGGTLPQTLQAHSQAFEQGTATLRRDQHPQNPSHHPGQDEDLGGNGDPRLDEDFGGDGDQGLDEGLGDNGDEGLDPGGNGDQDLYSGGNGDQDLYSGRNGDRGPDPGTYGDRGPDPGTYGDRGFAQDQPASERTTYRGTARVAAPAGSEAEGPDAAGRSSRWSVDGTCPGDGRWQAAFTVTRGGPTAPTGPAVPQGVRAGQGGTFTDSPAALAAGALLVLGACAAAVHRLRRDRAARH